MRGTYITTSLKLAVLAGSKKHKTTVNETKAVTDGHKIIWSKNSFATQPALLLSDIKLQPTEAI